MALSDTKIFNDMERRTAPVRQLCFLCMLSQATPFHGSSE